MTEPLRDKNGLTEEEFLASYSPKDYPRPSLTADNCIFRVDPGYALKLLLVRRGGHPFLGCWALPGGFVSPGETALEASRRELLEETGVEGLSLEPVGLYSAPGRDPRGWTISQAHIAVDALGATARAGDDAAAAAWFDVAATEKDGRTRLSLTANGTTLTSSFAVEAGPVTGIPRSRDVRGDGLAFDHAQIIADAWLLLGHSHRSRA
ncbi:NUDIX hydrolase [Tractidigestivibacter scatoligenes]|jgi:8-oxo-dGTP diphosphatase|uniref:NUDIX hydrolase n=1 Tax=Tractidigestivibacter scatoligenes TaxID=1299998 RepID=UPI002F35BC94